MLAPSSDSQPLLRAPAIILSHWVAQSAAVARGSAAARRAAASRKAVSPSCMRPRPERSSTSAASSSVTSPRASRSRPRSSTSTTFASGRSSAPPTISTITSSSSYVPRESAEVRVALLQERVAALDGLLGHVGQPRGLAGEQLLADQAVVDQVERILQHPLGGGALGDDPASPVQRRGLEL